MLPPITCLGRPGDLRSSSNRLGGGFHPQGVQKGPAEGRVVSEQFLAGGFFGQRVREVQDGTGQMVDRRDPSLLIERQDSASGAFEEILVEVFLHSDLPRGLPQLLRAAPQLRIRNIFGGGSRVKKKFPTSPKRNRQGCQRLMKWDWRSWEGGGGGDGVRLRASAQFKIPGGGRGGNSNVPLEGKK